MFRYSFKSGYNLRAQIKRYVHQQTPLIRSTVHSQSTKTTLKLSLATSIFLASVYLVHSTTPPIKNESSQLSNSVVKFEELQKHNTITDCWISVHGKVYDVTHFLEMHPGGAARILRFAGNDATKGFSTMHAPSYLDRYLEHSYIGDILDLPTKKPKKKKANTTKKSSLSKSHHHLTKISIDDFDSEPAITEEEKLAKDRLQNINNKPPLASIFSINDFEYVAKQVLTPVKLNYFATGSDDEFTLRENHSSLGRIFFRPRCLVDVENADTSTEFLGVPSSAPFYIGSFAGSHLIQDAGEKILTRAAGNEDIIHIIPKHGAFDLKEMVKETQPNQSVFYQYDFYTRKEVNEAPKLFQTIEKEMPQIKAIFLNSDVAVPGNREKDLKIRNTYVNDESNDYLNKLISDDVEYAHVSWKDFENLKKSTNLPIIIKGLQRKEDIVKACELGFKGVIISNHGGRQMDSSLSPIETLYQTRQLMKSKNLDQDKKFEIFVEGGFKRGTDILKALCLGAKPGLGRGFLYSEVYGQEGVERAIKILKAEVLRDMKLLGVKKVEELNEEFLDTASLSFRLNVQDNLYNENYTSMMGPSFKKSQNH